jgi:hypothetical protein
LLLSPSMSAMTSNFFFSLQLLMASFSLFNLASELTWKALWINQLLARSACNQSFSTSVPWYLILAIIISWWLSFFVCFLPPVGGVIFLDCPDLK